MYIYCIHRYVYTCVYAICVICNKLNAPHVESLLSYCLRVSTFFLLSATMHDRLATRNQQQQPIHPFHSIRRVHSGDRAPRPRPASY